MHQECVDETRQLVLWTLPDAAPAVGLLLPQDGATLPPPPGTIVLERSVRSALPVAVGDTVTVRLSDGDTFRLTVAGFVNDMAVPPTTVQPVVFGTIADATAARLGLPREANQLYVRLGAEEQERDAAEEIGVSSAASSRVFASRFSAFLPSSLAPGSRPLEPGRADSTRRASAAATPGRSATRAARAGSKGEVSRMAWAGLVAR